MYNKNNNNNYSTMKPSEKKETILQNNKSNTGVDITCDKSLQKVS